MNKERYEQIEMAVQRTKSKYCMDILNTLQRFPKLRQADIAKKIGITPGNLQNIMKKIMEAEPALVYNIAPEGKNKIFILSEDAEEYLKLGRRPEETRFQEDTPVERWISAAGYENRLSALEKMLDEPNGKPTELTRAFYGLVDETLRNGAEDGRIFGSREVYERLWEYAKKRKSDSRGETELHNLYHKNWLTAFRLIDYIFETSIYQKWEEIPNIYKAFELEDEETYEAIKNFLVCKVDAFKDFLDKKEKMFRALGEESFDEEPLSFYLSEKMNMISRVR